MPIDLKFGMSTGGGVVHTQARIGPSVNREITESNLPPPQKKKKKRKKEKKRKKKKKKRRKNDKHKNFLNNKERLTEKGLQIFMRRI